MNTIKKYNDTLTGMCGGKRNRTANRTPAAPIELSPVWLSAESREIITYTT